MDNITSATVSSDPIVPDRKELNVNTDFEKLKVDVFLKTCQNPPDYQGILRILEEEIKKIRGASEVRLTNLRDLNQRFT